MRITVIDGQGGMLGAQLVKAIKASIENADITAVGTNAVATQAMLKAGANAGATGENPVIVAARRSDVIIGPIGIVITDSLLGEITADMAAAIGRSEAVRILIPMNKCDNIVAGVTDCSTSALIDDVIRRLKDLTKQ